MTWERAKALIVQMFKFGIVGVLNTIVDYVVFLLLTSLPFVKGNAWIAAATFVSYACGVLNSLVLNKRFTFGDRGAMGTKRLIAFVLVNVVSWAVSASCVLLLMNGGMARQIAKAIAAVPSLAVNFVGNKLFVFREEKRART